MAASSGNKLTAVHFSLIFFVMLSLVFGVLWYLEFNDNREKTPAQIKATADYQVAEAEKRKFDEQGQALRKIIGYEFDVVGEAGDGDKESVIGASEALLATVTEKTKGATTFRAALDLLALAVKSENEVNNQRTDKNVKLEADFNSDRDNYQKQITKHQEAVDGANQRVNQLVTEMDEKLKQKNDELQKLQDSNLQLAQSLDNEKQARVREVKKLNEETVRLEGANDLLREKLDEATKVSFEQPDGEIILVDNVTRKVWINLGEVDLLRIRTSFSVYVKSHQGVARGNGDIKGSIEVVRIIDAHTAEARILVDDIYRPMAKGDPIYTPLWSPGRQEIISFVGLIDLDRDGAYDRERLHEIVAATGAAIDNEVDDEGVRRRYTRFPDKWVPYNADEMPGIDANTKFLVMGKIPDLSYDAKTEEQKDQYKNINTHLKEMQKEARVQGVRPISLNDFLSWLGYEPQRRLYVPGLTERKNALKAGAASATVDESIGDRSSAGTVSGAYGTGRRLKPKSSSGTDSPAFRSGGN